MEISSYRVDSSGVSDGAPFSKEVRLRKLNRRGLLSRSSAFESTSLATLKYACFIRRDGHHSDPSHSPSVALSPWCSM